MNSNILIAVLLLGLVIFHLYNITVKVKNNAYNWWYMPWFALAYTSLMYLLYNKTNFPDWGFIQRLFYEEYQIEAAYSLLCIAVWTGLQFLLRSDDIHEALLPKFRRLFAKEREDIDRVLPFPYFIDHEQVVRSKVGNVFYRWTLKAFIFIITVSYALLFLLISFNVLHEFHILSAFGILGLLPLLDYYVYLCSEVPAETETVDTTKKGPSDFDLLWRLFVDMFDNFSVAWKKTLSPEEQEMTRGWEKGNNDDFDDLVKQFMDRSKKYNVIIENYDVLTAFKKLEPVFDYVENNGRHILIALDIPNHFNKSDEKSFVGEIAEKLSETLRKEFYLYDRKSSRSKLNNSIVIAPLSLISRQGMEQEWLKKIGLVTVVDFFDKGVSNMYECRKFSYILQSINKEYQVVFVAPFRRGVEPSLRNTWLTGHQMEEKLKLRFAKGNRQFFIGYDFEDFRDRFDKILSAMPNEPLYSGSEMAPIALSSKFGELVKVVTPVHYLELAYSNAIEGKEELGKFNQYIRKEIIVAKLSINESILNHLLPVDRIQAEQVFSVIYDVDNNAPSIYNKWEHLGDDENFSIVISKPYLFRDYFNANHDFFVSAPFDALQPHLCKSRLTLAIILLNILQKAEVDEVRLRDLLVHYYPEKSIRSVCSIVKDLFKSYFSSDLGDKLMTTDKIVFDGEKYVHQIKYNLSQLTGFYTPDYLEVVSVKDESGNVLLELLYDLMYQNYDKGQIHSFSGKPYLIKDYNSSTKTLNVSKVNNSSKDILFYKAAQTVSIGSASERTPIDGMRSKVEWRHRITDEPLSIQIEGFEVPVTVKTEHWYEFNKYTVYDCGRIPSETPMRSYPRGKVLKISFVYPKQRYAEGIEQIRKSLQLLLYEAMQSVFPHQAQYLLVSSIGEGDKELPWIFNRFHCDDPVEDGKLSFYFIEDAHIDLGLIGALAADPENIRYILQYLYDYLIWLTEGGPESDGPDTDSAQPCGYEEYLTGKKIDRFSFLKYGKKSLPSYFDIDLLINFIKDSFQNEATLNKPNAGRQSKLNVIGSCDFCGKKMRNNEMQRLDDGRMRCPDCSRDAIDTEEQFRNLCNKVKEAFLTHLGIDFSTIPHEAKFVSAVELHKLGDKTFSITNGYDIRKLVGLACNRDLDKFYVENGYNADKTFGIIAHEMTHIWEYNDPDFKKVRQTNEDLVEGLAVWTDLFLSEKEGATDIEARRAHWISRTDEYGRGLRFIMEHCPDDPYGYIHQQAKTVKP